MRADCRSLPTVLLLASFWLAPAGAAAARPKAAAHSENNEQVEVLDVDAPALRPHVAYYGDAFPSMDRGLDQLNAHTLRRRTFATWIGHRNREGLLRAPFHDLLGFDGGGLKILLGLRYAFLDDFDVGFIRQNGTYEVYDTWEFDARYRLMRQSTGRPFDLAVRLGLDWYSAPRQNGAGLFTQVLVSRLIGERALLTAGILYASNSSGPTKSRLDAASSTALLLQADLRLLQSLALDIEFTQNLAGFHERFPVIAVGPKIISNRHTFSFVVANSQYMTADSLVANTYTMGAKDWVLGFHITREIDI